MVHNDVPLVIRPLAAREMHLPIDWAAAEGWNPGLHDGPAFHAADPEGFLVAERSGVPVSVISAVRTGTGFGFVGFYITAPGCRGRGYGLTLWRHALARLAGRTVGLDGVVAQQANYARSGFVPAHRNLRYGGTGRMAAPAAGIVPLSRIPWEQLIAFDTLHFGCARPAFLRAWLDQPSGDSQACACLRDGELRGYGVVRRCRSGCKMGPLFALSADDADALLTTLAAFAPGEPLFIDPPEPNQAAVDLVRRHGFTPVFETTRMYLGPPPLLPLARIYGITSFELG